jgi:hypothetical protein
MAAIITHILVEFMELGSANMLSELHKKINDIVPINGLSTLENGSVVVNYINLPTPEQEALISSLLSNLPLTNAKFEKLSEIDNEWKQTVQNGWQTPSGWKIGMDTQDITLLTGLFMLAKEASMLGITDPVTVIDLDGQPHNLTLSELTTLMLQYGAARAALSTQYANRRNLVNLATTIEELDSI